jgi:hypothetical protein
MPDNMGEEIGFGDNLETENGKHPCGFRGIHYRLGCGFVALERCCQPCALVDGAFCV